MNNKKNVSSLVLVLLLCKIGLSMGIMVAHRLLQCRFHSTITICLYTVRIFFSHDMGSSYCSMKKRLTLIMRLHHVLSGIRQEVGICRIAGVSGSRCSPTGKRQIGKSTRHRQLLQFVQNASPFTLIREHQASAISKTFISCTMKRTFCLRSNHRGWVLTLGGY